MERSSEQFAITERANGTGLPHAIHWRALGSPPDSTFTWEQAIRVLRKNRALIVLLALGLTACFIAIAFFLKDVYQPTARLQIDPPGSGIRTLHEIDAGTSSDDQDYLETQVQVLRSDELAMSVIRNLHLDQNQEFASKKGAADEAGIPGRAETGGLGPGNQNSFVQEHLRLAERTTSEASALETFKARLAVNAVHNTRLAEVSFTSRDPELAQLITNTLVTQFIDRNHRNRYTSTMEASEWLSAQLGDLRGKVEESNQAVADYQKRYGLVELDDHDVPLSQLMIEVNHQLSDAQANRIEAEAYVRMLDLGQTDTVPALRDNEFYQNVMTRYADARAQLAQARTVYGDENANVKKLQNATNELASEIDSERTRMANRVRASFAAARAREEMMLENREKLLAQMGDANSHLVAYRVLKNEALANAELYNTLQGRLKEAGIYAGLGSDNIHIVDLAARLQHPTGPHRGFIIAVGSLFSFVFAVLVAFVRESLDNAIRTPEDVKKWTGLSSMAIVPAVKRPDRQDGWRAAGKQVARALGTLDREPSESPTMVWTRCLSRGAEAMRDLRTSIMLWRPEQDSRLILVSSPSAGEGKTTVALNLAIAFAQRSNTCLLECDLRRPMIAKALALPAKAGLSHVLNGVSPWEDAVVEVTGIPNLCVISGGPVPLNPYDLIASERMRSLTATLREKFDRVVIDSPPVIPFSDARQLSSLCDAVVLVSRYGVTTRRAMERCAESLEEVQARIAGVVLNGIDHRSPDYHYYNYGYSKRRNGDFHGYPMSNVQSESEPSEPEPKRRATGA